MKALITLLLVALAFVSACTTSAVVVDRSQPVLESPVTLPDSARYTLDTSHSALRYAAYRFTGNGHHGNVGILDGYLVRDSGQFTGGAFTIDMMTIAEDKNNTRFLTHIRSEDFFDIERYPTSTFVVTNITQNGNELMVGGDLTILNATNSITFPATLTSTDDGIMVDAAFTIDRTRWGITYDSKSLFAELGDRAIKDDIEYGLSLQFTEE